MTVENDDAWQYCISCTSWSNQSWIFDIMWFRDVRMHVTIVFFCKSVWKTTKLWIWKDVNSVPFLCEDTNQTNWFFLSFESSSNNLLDKFQLGDFWIVFLIASLRIDEWWISSQNHNLAILFVVVQSTNTSSLYEWKLIPEYWVNICVSVCVSCLSPCKLSWGLYLDWLFVVLFVKLHRMSCDISFKCLIVFNLMVFPFLLLFYIHFILIPTYIADVFFLVLVRSCVCRILDLYHVLMYVCRLYWFLLPTIFLLVLNSYVCRNYIPKWNNMFVGFAILHGSKNEIWLDHFSFYIRKIGPT